MCYFKKLSKSWNSCLKNWYFIKDKVLFTQFQEFFCCLFGKYGKGLRIVSVCFCLYLCLYVCTHEQFFTLKCDSLISFSPIVSPSFPPSSHEPSLALSGRGLGTPRGEICSGHGKTQISALGYKSAHDTMQDRRMTDVCTFIYPLSCTNTLAHKTRTYMHTVVLIKALSVSREICNPDI